ncbi:MAG TPA: CPBP family glutamic-type intramembrane protease [Propionibacteriaceae bacterium]
MALFVDEVERIDHRPGAVCLNGHLMGGVPMTLTLNPGSTDRMLRGFATRRPEWFAVLASLAYILPLVALRLLAPEQASTVTANPVLLGDLAWRVLVPTALLTMLGWWGVAGFTRRSTWRSLVPFLPLILLLNLLPLLGLMLGVASYSLGSFTVVAVSMLAVGFGDQATFRGVVLQTLLPHGTMRAVIISSVLYGAAYTGTIAAGVDPVLVGVQALNMVGMGVAFAAVVVVTGTIWPLVLIDAASQIPFYFMAGERSRPDIVTIVIELVMGALAAAYGIWLLHRHQHRHADHSGEDGQFSAPRNHRQPEVKPR